MTSNPFVVIGVMMALGAAMKFLRFWTAMQGNTAARRDRMSRINGQDSHLSFDERIAERMRELEREQRQSGDGPAVSPAAGSPAAAPQGFGRRQP